MSGRSRESSNPSGSARGARHSATELSEAPTRTVDVDAVVGPLRVSAGQSDSASAPGRDRDTLPAGTELHRYRIDEVLGRGGMGVVYRAHDPELDRAIAIKLLRLDSRRQVLRAQREAQALARLSHPNVVSVYDVGTFRGEVFIALELIDGVTLQEWLGQGERSVTEIVALFVAAGRGLAAAHAAGLVHRDFKPSNVVVGDDDRARVLDFGLARIDDELSGDDWPVVDHLAPTADPHAATAVLSEAAAPERAPAIEPGAATASGAAIVGGSDERTDHSTPPAGSLRSGTSSGGSLLSSQLTRVGAIIGTPAYMAPEQHAGQRVTARADQYSFCVALYEALYGTMPFTTNRDPETLRRAALRGQLRPPPEHSRVPRRLRTILARGLARTPGDRYPSMDVLLDALLAPPRARRWALIAGA
ncbi:MAG: serine/threonine-protein kinase, partial [Myxococcota bacterium]